MVCFQKQFVFQSSSLAAATGNNPYKKATEILENMWYLHSQNTFRKTFDQAAIKSIRDVKWKSINAIPGAKDLIIESRKQGGNLTSITKLQEKAATSGNEIQQRLDSVTSNIIELKKKITTDASLDQTRLEKLDRDAEDAAAASQVVKQEIEKTLNMAFGTEKEADAVAQYEKISGISVNRERKLTKVCYNDDFWISGIVDGLIGDDCVLEVKNRSKRLFHKIPNYEMIQVQAYMHNLHKSRAVLLECLKKDDHFDFNPIEVDKDDRIWSSVLSRLNNFSTYLKILITDESEAAKYGSMSAVQRDAHFHDILKGITGMQS